MSNAATRSILDEAIEPAAELMTPEVARWLLALRAGPDLQVRVDELADKNTEGTITAEELAEYDEYLAFANVIAALQPRAKAVLSPHGG